MHPVLFEASVGSVEIVLRAYSTFLVLAGIVAVGLGMRRLRPLGVGGVTSLGMLLASIVVGLVGARTLDVLLNLDAFAADPATMGEPAARGFALYGGLIGASATMTLLARWRGVPFRRLADAMVVPVAAGIMLIRVGCFLNGCCAGVETDVPWAVEFPAGSVAWDSEVSGTGALGTLMGHVDRVHPTQLYEAAAVIALAGIAELARRRGTAPGVPAILFGATFLAFRSANQTLRPTVPGASLDGPAVVVLYAMAAALAAIVLMIAWRSTVPDPTAVAAA